MFPNLFPGGDVEPNFFFVIISKFQFKFDLFTRLVIKLCILIGAFENLKMNSALHETFIILELYYVSSEK